MRGTGRSGQRGQPLVQGEFVRAARPREHLEAPYLRQQRRQLGPLRQAEAAQRQARLERRPHHLEPHQRVPGVAVPARALRGDQRRVGPAPGQRPLDQGVRGEHPPGAAHAARQHQVGQPDEPRVVFDERGLGLFDVHGRTGRGGGRGGRGGGIL